MKDLPQFAERPLDDVYDYAKSVFTRGEYDMLMRVETYDDGHYRAVFDVNFFNLHEGYTEPTRSQWSTLKKHMKRIDKAVFVFKDHGYTEDGYCYVDFGFFAN